jgi:repressor LexA
MQPELTSKQQVLRDYLEQEITRTGKAPSLRQAAAKMGVSHAAVSQLVKALEAKGVIKRDGRYSRTIHLLNATGKAAGFMRSLEVPIVGTITAGLPLYAQQEWDGSVVVDGSLYRGAHLFGLRVKGDSMKNAAILDGDIVICEPRQYAENGEIIVALIQQEEATVKRFFRRKNHIELQPENIAYSPMKLPFSDVLVQGKVIGIQRGPDVMRRL